MKVAQIQFVSWDKIYNFTTNNLELKIGDDVIVKTELGSEIGKVVGFDDVTEDNGEVEINNGFGKMVNKKIKPVTRLAEQEDFEKIPSQEEKDKAIEYAKEMKKKFDLPMKFIDVHFSLDGSRITFAFIANGRVDFRELVREMARHFSRTIRLQQIGIRDEAKIMGDYGHCGQELCCRTHLKNLSSITSEMAEVQQCSHRSSDRISGVCGRLMCCLAYEFEGYEHLNKKLPPMGTKVNVDGKKGIVVGHQPLKESVSVKFENENGKGFSIVEVDLNRHKKKKK